ncbi:hypothetical protein C8Q69DRAFT_53290 [Paecilomyces variotii]|uniref:Uncharacterized protein n=1 Tax=Byssochlamys spectabilis TaxID=264951 RepID=A0A443I854_BYSSP|nr:hypothetical protein C8Q69DRAFT_53290 [Paecilomyces variotii]KAJ9258002.1 hypothetical protein DTO207G8_1779 [Paecilomyces variotii]KAJ9365819.1 hypothetical protein DTO280E4_115 [Paecilomyces variotii]KAJ9386713.1 hypothetical protein DTO063F5_3371 [Paecilomyces variotii]RWR00274.1 hypothetical protein C8Q69DRAFT_53290 [Paecilomyces variotii]
MFWKTALSLLSCALAVSAIPQQTPSPSSSSYYTPSSSVTVPPSSTITPPPATLSCSSGSTILYTTDCTMGFPISYCHSPEPPIQCSSGYYPSVWHPEHCVAESTCYPVDSPYITTKCSNGGTPYTTSTLYEGTLAGGESTTITNVGCSCAANQWYSMTLGPGGSTVDTYCMPHSACPAGMSTSVSTNSYCATAPASACSDIPLTTDFCVCQNPTATAVYPSGDGAVATGCA